MSKELLKSVREVFKEGKHYNIPEYQRGYKWTSQNVKTLLDDLSKFEDNHNKKDDYSFYCLQNITLVPAKDGYNVVDGQQRLTTLYILMSYLKKKGQLDESLFYPDCLRYSVREETHKLLSDEIATGKVWDSPINPNDAERKDQWYILDVAKGIKEWFEDDAHTLDTSTITDHLKLIENAMEKGNENDIFAGLNGGKVDLDGADLVRAELITRAAREKYRDLDPNKVGEFRVHIGLVLDEMVKWWNDPDHYTFFNQMLPNDKDTEEFSNSYKINTLYRLYFEAYKTDKDKFGFSFFENGHDINKCQGDDHYELYASLIAMHNTLKDWYNSPNMYHWIGYVSFNFKQFPEVSFAKLWELWNKSENKQDFLCQIKRWILFLVAKRRNPDAVKSFTSEDIDKDTVKSVWNELLKDVDDLSYDWYNDAFLNELLILIEILWMEKNGYTNRLKVSYLRRNNKENREHIRSCCPNKNEEKENRSREDWLHFVKEAYNSDKDAEIRKSLLNLLNSFDEQLTEDNIASINAAMNRYAQNSIGNLVLLDEHINKSYGNALYREKVQRIIMENAQNKYYVRPYTFDIFLQKVNSNDSEWRWSQEDIQKTIERSHELLDNFLNGK